MKLDLLYEVQAPKPWPDKPYPYNQREAEQAAYFEAIEQIKLADKLGFGTVWIVEHHFRIERSHMPVNDVFLAALSQVTDQIRLGFGVTLTPHKFRHPVRTAEVVAAVDLLSRGRVEWGTGRSIPHEQKAFGVDPATSRDSWREAIEAIVAMWEREKFSWDSEFMKFPEFPSFEGDTRSITPKPYQDPHPPAWMAAVSPGSVELAGQLGLGMLALTIMQPVDELARRIKIYRDASASCTEPLTRVKNNKVAPYTLVHCAEDMEQAEAYGLWDSVAWWYDHMAQFLIDWELPPNVSAEEIEKLFPRLRDTQAGKVDPKFFSDQDMIIVGDPDQCLEKLVRYEAIGCDSVICYVQFGQLQHNEVMESIEMLGKHVIPKLEQRVGSKLSS
jgi:alkanesulfonate monooxygenase SsuD/methylene tetrahydromethanopterin reductase-like flavin-dependent oxidoreductase (luciferase family)